MATWSPLPPRPRDCGSNLPPCKAFSEPRDGWMVVSVSGLMVQRVAVCPLRDTFGAAAVREHRLWSPNCLLASV